MSTLPGISPAQLYDIWASNAACLKDNLTHTPGATMPEIRFTPAEINKLNSAMKQDKKLAIILGVVLCEVKILVDFPEPPTKE